MEEANEGEESRHEAKVEEEEKLAMEEGKEEDEALNATKISKDLKFDLSEGTQGEELGYKVHIEEDFYPRFGLEETMEGNETWGEAKFEEEANPPPSDGLIAMSAELDAPRSSHQHSTKSMFGTQILSNKLTEPSCSFGTSNRTAPDKLYINAELAKCNSGRNSPGPIYQLNSSLGKQWISTNESLPEVHFGISNRFSRKVRSGKAPPGPGSYNSPSSFGDQVLSNLRSPSGTDFGRSTRDQQKKFYFNSKFDKGKYGLGSPGPTVCDERSCVGPQIHSLNRTAAKTFFGSENRFKHHVISRTAKSPGIGQYESINAIGKQPESKKSTKPSISLLGSNREQRSKVYISTDHEKALYGIASPGPASSLKIPSSLGYQPDSRKSSSSSWKFGCAARFKPLNDEKPGPGAYDC